MNWLAYAPYCALSAVYCADAWGKGRLSRYLKPLLMPALFAAYALSAAEFDALIALGLALGWVGDCALMLPGERYGDKPFMVGLGAFMLGHAMYMARFIALIGGLPEPWTAAYAALEALIGIWLYRALRPGLGGMKLPVIAYEAVILLMSACAFGALLHVPGAASACAWAGSVCFVASDALLAMGIFRGERPRGHFLVMALYTPAQLLIALSAALG